ncbi:hypothetical protein NC653_019918 [Populus alba x Populus x berolinensis]|uniref:Uncharacterized protein n=1 Tax=Populus alba x Populus x berolinensis TaxID=444605 RepID=A0AAD6MJ45_9ROSI|nr:hypothetical protein NC653_019918 [Populus alba x Populus x berolinensis]
MKEEKRKHISSYDSVLVNVLLATHSCRSIFDKKDYDVIRSRRMALFVQKFADPVIK